VKATLNLTQFDVASGMQDFNYLATNCFSLTLELSCEKFPSAVKLPQFWQDNKEALLNFMWQVSENLWPFPTSPDSHHHRRLTWE